jgi:hypothetical protein
MKQTNKKRASVAPYLWGPGVTKTESTITNAATEKPWVLLFSAGLVLCVLSGIIA